MSTSPYFLYLLDSNDPLDAYKVEYRVDKPHGTRYDSPRFERAKPPSEIEWLWPGRIPLGKVMVIEGAPAAGKTWVALDMAARITCDDSFPDGAPNPWPDSDVLVISRHKDEVGRIAKRFQPAAGASAKLHRLGEFHAMSPQSEQGELRPVAFPFDMQALAWHLEWQPSIGVVVIDPLSDFCPTPRLFAETLHQLNALAASHRVAIIVTVPANCRADRDGTLKVTSRWPTDAARWVWSIIPDPDDPSRRLLAARRANFCPEPDGLAFRLTDDGVAWEADSKVSPVDPAGQLTACDLSLQELLRGGALPAATVYRLGGELGYSPKELRAAATRLGAGSARVGFGEKGRWVWALPAQSGTQATVVVRDTVSRTLPVDAEPQPGAERLDVESEDGQPEIEGDAPAEQPRDPSPALPGPAVEAICAARQTSDDRADRECPIKKLSDSPAAGHPTPTEPAADAVTSSDDFEPGTLNQEVDDRAPDPEHVRPLSKRKAKKARRKLARQRAAELRQVGAGLTSATDDPMATAVSGG